MTKQSHDDLPNPKTDCRVACAPRSDIKRVAFTLSEVLITLVIIGIVAALTIPAISRSTQKYILRNQFKKAYSAIVTAMNKADTDLGGNSVCYYFNDGYSSEGTNSDCRELYEQMFKNLSVQKVCRGNAKANGCIPSPYIEFSKTTGSTMGFKGTKMENDDTVYNLADGTIIILYEGNERPLFLVDINGAKGPNVYGKDAFIFYIVKYGANGLKIAGNKISDAAEESDRWFKSINDIYKE